MSAERLLAHYEQIGDAPDAIARLRRFILDLAVRGKLVPQDASDEPASELLKRFAKAKTERKKETGDARVKMASDPKPDGLAMLLPRGWAVQSFENLFLFIDYRGNTPPKTNEGIPLITAKNIRMGYLNREPREYISKATFKTWMTRGFPGIGDLLFTTEAPLANICLNDIEEPFALAQRAICFHPYARIDTKFLMFALMSDVMQSLIENHATGMTAKGIKAANLKPLPIPIPPLTEQHRIVGKVDELMGLCNELDAARAGREGVRDRLAAASLARLNAPDPETFKTDACFALNALPFLTTRPDQIKPLRHTILNLAIRGKLVPQDANDEPASELVKRISMEKAQLVTAGEIRKEKALLPVSDADQSFELPHGWSWVRLGDLSKLVTSGSRDWAQHYSNEGAIFVRMGNLSKDHYRLRLDHIQRVNPPSDGEGTRTRLEAGDVLISITGDVGMLGLIPEGFGEAYINQHTAMVRPMAEMRGRFLAELFCSPFAQGQFNEPQRGIKNSFRLTDVTQFIVPLPPLAEQRRIVAKIDTLMALLDRLETNLTANAASRRRLLDALLAEALIPAEARELELAE